MTMNYTDFDYAVGQHISGLLDAFWQGEDDPPKLFRPDQFQEGTKMPEHFVQYRIDHPGYDPVNIGNRNTATQRHNVVISIEIWTVRGQWEQEALKTKSFFQTELEGAIITLQDLNGETVRLRVNSLRTPAGSPESDYFVSALYITATYDIVAGDLQRNP